MADDEDQSSKTEDPTEHRLNKLREQGNVPKSREVNNLFMLIAMMLTIGLTFPALMESVRDFLGTMLVEVAGRDIGNAPAIGRLMATAASWGLLALLPTFLILLVFAWFGGFIQTGPIFSADPIKPKLSKISFTSGFKKIFSMKSMMEFLKSVLKLVIIGAAVGAVIYFQKDEFLLLPGRSVGATVVLVWWLTLQMLAAALIVMILLATIDILFQRADYTKENRMSRRELKDEFKETEGDPFIKQRQRQIRQERARRRMMQEVPKANVVITNPTHYAVALQYEPDEGMAAPLVLAKGADHLAARIREVAAEHDIPFYEDPPLARQLYRDVDIGDEIPVDLYGAVAPIIAYVYNLKKRRRSA